MRIENGTDTGALELLRDSAIAELTAAQRLGTALAAQLLDTEAALSRGIGQ